MKNLFKNWKTNSAGILSITGGVVLYLDDNTKVVESLSLVLTGLGFIFAKDFDKPGK